MSEYSDIEAPRPWIATKAATKAATKDGSMATPKFLSRPSSRFPRTNGKKLPSPTGDKKDQVLSAVDSHKTGDKKALTGGPRTVWQRGATTPHIWKELNFQKPPADPKIVPRVGDYIQDGEREWQVLTVDPINKTVAAAESAQAATRHLVSWSELVSLG